MPKLSYDKKTSKKVTYLSLFILKQYPHKDEVLHIL